MFKVDSHLPIPPPKSGPQSRYPFGTMKKGESFVVSAELAYKARNAANAYKIKHEGWNYTARLDDEGLRIWRTA